MKVSDAIASRKTVRAFKSDPVPRATVEAILRLAARGAVGRQSAAVEGLRADRTGARRAGAPRRRGAQDKPMGRAARISHLSARPHRALQGAALRDRRGDVRDHGIPREDKAARLRFFSGNWEFFGAPVGLIFTIDRIMQQGQWADLGMFLQNVMLLAREHGLHTCPQEAWAMFHATIRDYLQVPDNELIFCGMALASPTRRRRSTRCRACARR